MSPLKPSSLALACGAFLLAIPSAFAGPRIGGGDLFFEGTVSYSDTNKVSPRAYSSSDTYMTFTPRVRFQKDNNGNTLNGSLSLPFRRYDESKYLDSESIILNLNGEIPFGNGPRLSGKWGVNYFNGFRTNFDTNRNLDTTVLNVNLYADYLIRNKLSIRARAGLSDRDNSGIESEFSNENKTDYYAVGLHARELIAKRVGAYVEYRIQNRETQNGVVNEDDDAINFGLTGQVLPERLFPKLEADLSFGFASTNRDGNSRNRLTLDGSLAYPLNSKSKVSLNYNRNFAVTDDDRSVERGRLNLDVDYTPNQKIDFAVGFGILTRDYLNDQLERKDDTWTARFRTNYRIKQNWFTTLQYDYRDSSSIDFLSDYSFGTVTLSTTVVF